MTENNPAFATIQACACGREFPSPRSLGAHAKKCERATREYLFWVKVEKRGPDECWPWQGAITTHGYGCFNWHGRVLGAHKLAYVLTNGEVPSGLQVCHTCDNRRCCNPKHYFLGTKKDNAADAVARASTPAWYRGRHYSTSSAFRMIITLKPIPTELFHKPRRGGYG